MPPTDAHEALIAAMNSRKVRMTAAEIVKDVVTMQIVTIPTADLPPVEQYAAIAMFALACLNMAAREIGLETAEVIAVLRDIKPFGTLPV